MQTAEKTAEKATRPKLTESQTEKVRAILQFHDRHWYGTGITLGRANDIIEHEIGVKVGRPAVSRIAKTACAFWKQRGSGKRPSKARGFTHEGWERMRGWIRTHRGDIDLKLDTNLSIWRRMRYAGVTVSKAAAIESLLAEGIQLQSEPQE